MKGGASSGFSLVETLVALAVIAAMSALLFEAVSANARFAQATARKREAVLLAQSLLAAATAPGARTMAESGNGRELSWRVTRILRSGGARDSNLPLEEVRIAVADRATGRGLTSVRTLRLAR